MNSKIRFRRMDRIRFVNQAGMIPQAEEPMRKTHRDINDVAVLLRKFKRSEFAERGRFHAKVQKHVQNGSGYAINDLLVCVGRNLEVHATQNAFVGGRKKFLPDVHLDPVLPQLAFMEWFYKIPTRVFDGEGLEYFDSGQRFVDECHGMMG